MNISSEDVLRQRENEIIELRQKLELDRIQLDSAKDAADRLRQAENENSNLRNK